MSIYASSSAVCLVFKLVQKGVYTSVTVMFGEDKACASQQGDKGGETEVKG